MKRKHVAPTEFERSDAGAIVREGEGSESTAGTFTAVLATQGEASDGHILSIAGNKTPARMPLLFGHRSEAMTPSLGSVTKPIKGTSLDGKTKVLRTTQVVNMEGEGQMAEIRRNVALLVDNGDLNGMSVRWVPDEVVRRIDLPRNHFAFVDSATEDRDSERYWGFFHKRSHSQEGSVVAVGADPGALVGRAQELKGGASAVFFRALAHSVETGERVDGMGQLSSAFAAYDEAIAGMRTAGVSPDDLAMMVGLGTSPSELMAYNFIDGEGNPQSTMLVRSAYESLRSESSAAFASAISLAGESREAKAPEVTDENLTPEELDAKHNRVYPKRVKRKKAVKTYQIKQRTIADLDSTEFERLLGSAISTSVRSEVAKATGRIIE